MKVGYFNLAVAAFIGCIGVFEVYHGQLILACVDAGLAALNISLGIRNI
jgi:hypothetical protein